MMLKFEFCSTGIFLLCMCAYGVWDRTVRDEGCYEFADMFVAFAHRDMRSALSADGTCTQDTEIVKPKWR